MRTLVIDCATEACSVALFDDGVLLAGDFRVLGRGHAEQLVPMIAALPERGRAGRIAVALGPGSFTGVRVGLAAARALSIAWRAELLGYPTLALVAAMARAASGSSDPIAVAMTGGHGEWFVQSFTGNGPQSALQSATPVDAVTILDTALVAGSQAEGLVALRGTGRALTLLPDAREFLHLPADTLSTAITPLYGRAPDARLPGGTSP